MLFAYLLSVYLGFAAVLQGGVNRKIAAHWGYPGATLLNSFVILVLSAVVFTLVRVVDPPELFKDKSAFTGFAWWYLLPGIFGFSLIFLVPVAIEKLGALNLFVALIASQLLGGAVWDYFMEGIPVTKARLAGAALAFAGALLATLR